MPGRVLIVEDDAAQGDVLRDIAEEMGYAVTLTRDPRSAATLYTREKPDLIVLDIIMPDMDGLEVIRALAAVGCTARIVLISGSDPRYLQSAEKLGKGYDLNVTVVAKPLSVATIRRFMKAKPHPLGA